MAGHSKFKNIMHRKGAQDAKRARQFARLAREITVAARMGLPDPEANPRLRAAIGAARAANMPNDRIKRAIEVSQGNDAENYDEVRYEGYGPGGIAIVVEALTDNRNRTAADIRAIFSKNGGTLGETGSVVFMFERIGRIAYPLAAGDHETLFEAAAEAGAEDVETGDAFHEVITDIDAFASVRDALYQSLGDAAESGLVWRPQTTTEVDEETAATLLKLVDALDDHDDVQSVTANFDIADEVMERLAAA